MAIKLLIYDDSDAIRLSMEALFSDREDFAIAGLMSNAETVETDIAELKPDIVLMDIDMPVVDGVGAVKRIRKINNSVPILMLTIFDDNEHIFSAICAGASGYLLKSTSSEELIYSIKNVLAGGAPMSGSVAKKVLGMIPRAETESETVKALSAREIEILGFLVKGYSYKMIASELGISIDTIRFHIKNIYEKLHVHSATEAVSKAIKDRLVSILAISTILH
ncbi:MAG: response regulator transcription factor [Chitinophagaceae bacterium]|nr:response regulator transcription factor [Chitinophagaceae bacterium]